MTPILPKKAVSPAKKAEANAKNSQRENHFININLCEAL
jgi:hypothetical protein